MNPDLKNFESIITTIRTIATSIFGLLAIAMVVVAIMLAYKFFTATEEGKRKNAKAQLIYAIIGLIALVLLLAFTGPIMKLIGTAMKEPLA